MNIQKETLPINFAKGVDQKSDPWQVSPDRFQALQNTVFNKIGLLTKRNGFGLLSTVTDSTVASIKTYQENLTAIGTSFYAYNEDKASFVNKGAFAPLSLEVLSLIKNSLPQIQCDSATASNGAVCTVYTENNNGTKAYKYAVLDGTTGQILIAPAAIAPTAGSVTGSPRVFVLGPYFVIVFTATITGTEHLQYVAISYNSFVVNTAVDLSSAYTSATTVNFDGYVANNKLYLAWNSSGGAGILMAYLTSSLVFSSTVNRDAAHSATIMSVCSDGTYVYVSYYNLGTTAGYVFVTDENLNVVRAATNWIAAGTILNVASAAISGTVTIFYETSNAYSYDGAIPTNFVNYKTVIASTGVVSAAVPVKRSVGLASKAFIVDSVIYVLTAFQSPYQPSYFLVSASGNIISELAYQNGGGYLTLGLPQVTVTDTVASIAYLFKDFIASQNIGATGVNQTANIYFQTGVNQVNFTIGGVNVYTSELGQTLNATGGFLWSYDGSAAFENGFFVYPDSIEATWSAIGGSIVAKPDGATNTNAYFYQVTYEWTDNQGNRYRSAPSIPISVTTTGALSTGSITVNVPTLRLSYKTNVTLNIYRWSVAQQSYFQVTSVTAPTVNNAAVDSIAYVDTLADASILGNTLLYTTGGVIEHTSTPSPNAVTIFDDRLWIVNAENPNVLWYSKQAIQNTPVEMSDLFTIYISPTQSAQGATGPITAIAPLDDKLVIFKKDAIYYMNGTGPDNTGSNSQYSQPIFITSTVGSENPNSIVFIPGGLLFQSDKGIWLLGRDLNTQYVGNPVEDYTNEATVNSAANIPATTQVRFTMSSGVTLVYDYFFEQWSTFVNAPAISSTIYQGQHTLLTPYSQILQETPGLYVDSSNPVLISFTTSWLNMMGIQGYLRAYFFYLLGEYKSPHKLQVSIAYDYSTGPTQVSLIQPTNFSGVYGGPDPNPGTGLDPSDPYGQDSVYGGGQLTDDSARGSVEQWRVFLAKQRCQSFQITVQEIYDPSFGVPPGEGLSMSGINIVFGSKKPFRPIPAQHSIGGGGNNL